MNGLAQTGIALLVVLSITLGAPPARAQQADDILRLGIGILLDAQRNQPQGQRTPTRKQTQQTNQAPDTPPDPMVADIQAYLNRLGYDAGPVDGEMGRRTRQAISQFQTDNGLPVTGQPSQDVFLALSQAGTSFAVADAQTAIKMANTDFVMLQDFDLPYGDYRSGLTDPGLRNVSSDDCVAACRNDPVCRAFTYNQSQRVCILKDTQPAPAPYAGALSGIRSGAPQIAGGAGPGFEDGSQQGLGAAPAEAADFIGAQNAGYADFVHLAMKPFIEDYREVGASAAIDYRFAVAGPDTCPALAAEWKQVANDAFALEDYVARAEVEFPVILDGIASTPDTVETVLRSEHQLGQYDFQRQGFPLNSPLASGLRSRVKLYSIDASPPCTGMRGSFATVALSRLGYDARETGLRILDAELEPVLDEPLLPMSREAAKALGDSRGRMIVVEAIVVLSPPDRPFSPLYGKARGLRVIDKVSGEVLHDFALGGATEISNDAPPTRRELVMMAMASDVEAYLAEAENVGAMFEATLGDDRSCKVAMAAFMEDDEFAIRDYLSEAGRRFLAIEPEIRAARTSASWETEGMIWLGDYDFDRGGYAIAEAVAQGPGLAPGTFGLADGNRQSGQCQALGNQISMWLARRSNGELWPGGQPFNLTVEHAGASFADFLPMEEAQARALSKERIDSLLVKARFQFEPRKQGRGPMPGRIEVLTFLHPETREVLWTAVAPGPGETEGAAEPLNSSDWSPALLADAIAPLVMASAREEDVSAAIRGYLGQQSANIANGNVPPGLPLSIDEIRGQLPEVIATRHRETLVAALSAQDMTLPGEYTFGDRSYGQYDPDRGVLRFQLGFLNGQPAEDGSIIVGNASGLSGISADPRVLQAAGFKAAIVLPLAQQVGLKIDRQVIFEEFALTPEEALQRGYIGQGGSQQPDEIDYAVAFELLGVEHSDRSGPMLVASIRRVTLTWASDNQVLYDQDFAGMPTYAEEVALKAPKSAAALPIQPLAEPVQLTAEVVDLLQLRHAPDTVDDTQMKRMLISRYAYEQSEQEDPGPAWGRFFPDVSTRFDPAMVDPLLPSFREWSLARAAALPETFVASLALNNGVPGYARWGGMTGAAELHALGLRCPVDQFIGAPGTEAAVKGQTACDFLEAVWPIPDSHLFLKDRSFGEALGNGAGRGPRFDCAADRYCQSIEPARKAAGFPAADSQGRTVPHHDLFAVTALPVVDAATLAGESDLKLALTVRVTGAKPLEQWPETPVQQALQALRPFVQSIGLATGITDEVRAAPPGSLEFETEVASARIVRGATGEVVLEPEIAAIPPMPLGMLEVAAPAVAAGWDVLGLKLGMSFDEAEKLIRDHMEVGHVLTADRMALPATATGRPPPYSSGRLFVSADQTELIAIVDEPPAAAGTVTLLWRILRLPPGSVNAVGLKKRLVEKYGEPVNETAEGGSGQVGFVWADFAQETGCGQITDQQQASLWQIDPQSTGLGSFVSNRYFAGPIGYPLESYVQADQLEAMIPTLCPPVLGVRLRVNAQVGAPEPSDEIVLMISDERGYARHYLDSLATGFGEVAEEGAAAEIEF